MLGRVMGRADNEAGARADEPETRPAEEAAARDEQRLPATTAVQALHELVSDARGRQEDVPGAVVDEEVRHVTPCRIRQADPRSAGVRGAVQMMLSVLR